MVREGGTNRADVCSRAMEENRSKAQTTISWDKLSVACFQAGQLGDKSIAVHSMKQALTLSSNVARAD